MNLNVEREVRKLKSMTVKMLQEKYIEVFSEETRSSNKDFLWKRIAWRLQALAEGDLSERARRRAEEIVDEADLRVRMPSGAFKSATQPESQSMSYSFQPDHDKRLPLPGAIINREYKGTIIEVMVLEKGFEYNGEVYRSLTAITRLVTGTRWNGYHFFGLQQSRGRA